MSLDPTRDVVFGHEFCCEVVEHGPGTDKRLKPGTLVCSMPLTIAGTTVQGIGYSNDIAGGFAQYMPLAERTAAGSAERAARRQGGAHRTDRGRAGTPCSNARLTADDVPLVIGCGPVGLSVIAGLTMQQRAPDHRRRFLAGTARAGAAHGRRYRDRSGRRPRRIQSWTRRGHTARATTAAATHSCSARGPKQRPAVIFECVGVPGVIEQIIDGAPAGARIVVVGVCMETDRVRAVLRHHQAAQPAVRARATPAQEFAASLHHIAEGHVDVTPLITGHVGLDGVKGAFADLANPEQHAKIMVEPWA